MKLAVSRPAAPDRLSLGRLGRLAAVAIGLAAVLAGVAFVVISAPSGRPSGGIGSWSGSDTASGIPESFSIALGSLLQTTSGHVPDIPDLVIDVPFENMRRIYAKRDEALARGTLVQGEDDFVNGEVRLGGRTIPIELRLKGDWNDHLQGRKWSFRIHTRRGEAVLGMRRFSIQSPETRGMQAELLFFEALRRRGLLVPRYSFANVTLNGDSMGLMAVEEFFAKELLEHNGRKESVIVRFDESQVWAARDSLASEPVGFFGVFDSYKNAPIDAFGSGQVAESPELSRLYAQAVGLLRGFIDGQLSAAEVFDAGQLGSFLAVADLFGSWHTLTWHNVRFYLNPYTMRLEPIAYDANLQSRLPAGESVVTRAQLSAALMGDPDVFAAYRETMLELAADADALIAELAAVEAPALALLRTEYRQLAPYPLAELRERAAFLTAVLERPNARQMLATVQRPNETSLYPTLLQLEHVTEGEQDYVEIRNAVPWQVRVISLDWVGPDNAVVAAVTLDEPVVLDGRSYDALPPLRRFALEPAPAAEGWRLFATAGIEGRNWAMQMQARRSYPMLDAVPVPVSTVDDQLARHPFLEPDGDRGLRIPAGRWTVEQSIVVPPGYALRIEAGARLGFGPTANLVMRGPLVAEGTAEAPVVLEPLSEQGWPGLVVLEAPSVSRLTHFHVSGTRGVGDGAWSLTGGVVFYRSEVEIRHGRFADSRGEDALNIVRSQFLLDDLEIRSTVSDAFDADFSNGSVSGGRFEQIRGDAIDVSGSDVTVSGTQFRDVLDKALSVGEASTMRVADVRIEDVGSGAAVKDGSRLEIAQSAISDSRFAALTAYIKKPEYGPAEIEASNIAVSGDAQVTLAQTGSRIELDGRSMPTQSVDVDELYATIMRPELSK